MLDQIKPHLEKIYEKAGSYLDYLKPWKTIPAFINAFKKAKESNDEGFFKKIDIFWKSFNQEVKGVEKEKGKTTADTEAEVSKGLEDTLKDAKAEVALDETVQGEDRKFYDEILATSVSSFEETSAENQGYALEGLKKTKEDSEDLSYEERSSLSGVGVITLKKLKIQYPDEEKFKEMLDKLSRISDKSKFPVQKLLNSNVLAIFKIKDKTEGLKFLAAIGITPSLGDVAEKGDASEAGDLLACVAKSPLERKEELVAFFKKYLFPSTEETKLEEVVKILNKMLVPASEGGSKQMDTEQLAKLAFCFENNNEFDRLIAVLTGQKGNKQDTVVTKQV